jgi:FixJ family two-component response regulator
MNQLVHDFNTIAPVGAALSATALQGLVPIGQAADSQAKPTMIHLIEPDTGLRARMARRLSNAGFHVEIYSSIAELVSFGPRQGVIVLDEAHPAGGLAAVSDRLERAAPGLPVVVFSNAPTIAGVVAAMRANAVNYLPADANDAEFAAALAQAHADGEEERQKKVAMARASSQIDRLSARERQVLELLIQGESNKGMARALELSPRTVEIHRTKLLAKLGVRTAAEAVRIWCAANSSH